MIFVKVISRHSAHVTITGSPVMWRHNFYTHFITAVLYVFMQFTVYACLPVGFFCVCIYLISYVKILQAGLQYKWFWVFKQAFCPVGSI